MGRAWSAHSQLLQLRLRRDHGYGDAMLEFKTRQVFSCLSHALVLECYAWSIPNR